MSIARQDSFRLFGFEVGCVDKHVRRQDETGSALWPVAQRVRSTT